jgi:hypothetical protein
MSDDDYDLYHLIETLEEIKEDGQGSLNMPKAIYCLAKEIAEIKLYLEYLHDMIPQKFKKFNPQPGENPFFSKDDIFDIGYSVENVKKAKERMEGYKKNAHENEKNRNG